MSEQDEKTWVKIPLQRARATVEVRRIGDFGGYVSLGLYSKGSGGILVAMEREERVALIKALQATLNEEG